MFFSDIFNTLIFIPFYNALILLTEFSGGRIGLAVVALTILVKLIILPLSHKSVTTQASLRKIDPEIKKLKDKHKGNQEEQARAIMNLYKKHGVNPFSGCLLTIIQIPIIFGLYWVFWKGLSGGVVNLDILYAFIPTPGAINFQFLGLTLVEKSITLSLCAALTQFFLMQLSVPPAKVSERKKDETPSFSDEFKKGLGTQARYVLPLVIGFVSLGFPSVVPLYWVTSNVFSISHELIVRKKAQQLLSKTKTP